MHHTKEKGDLGNIKIMADLSSQGFKILTPLSEHLPFDFVIYDMESNKLLKVQSKFKSVYRGVLTANLQTSYSTTKKLFCNRYADASFDVLAIYCPNVDKVVYILETDLRHLKWSINFSFVEKQGVRFVDNYTNLRKLLNVNIGNESNQL